MRIVVLFVAVLLVVGCGRSSKKKSTKPSVAQEMIDGATGHTAVKHGKRAMETLERVGAQEKKDYDEVLQD